jgi:hypothetical protein
MVFCKRILWISFFILLISGSLSISVSATGTLWDQVAPGIEYAKYELADPNNVFVVRMDRNNPSVFLESSIAKGKLAEGKESVSGMYNRYDQAINFWGGNSNPPDWSMRNQVVVAINGSYFDWGTGVPQGGQVQSGWYAKRYDDMGGWSGFAWKLDRSAFIGECVYHRPEKQYISYPLTGNTQQITHVNTVRGANDLVLYTPQYNSRTGTDNSGIEVLVEMARPTLILPGPAYASGTVRQVRNAAGNSWIPFNYIVLSATDDAALTLQANVQVGSEIRVSQEITSYEYDCQTPNNLSWTKTYASIQGAFFFLENGQVREFDDPGATTRNPRTAIAYNSQYIFFIVVDGRDIARSIGMNITQLAEFARDTLGATYGVAQDGGGSSTMVINGSVVNNTYCNLYTCTGDYKAYLPVTIHYGAMTKSAPPVEDQVTISPAGIERNVANGMLMVIAQPGDFSTAFSVGDPVTTNSSSSLLLGPGTNYATITTLSDGTSGIILAQVNGLNGVLAKGTYWWYASFGSVKGWVTEDALAAAAVK